MKIKNMIVDTYLDCNGDLFVCDSTGFGPTGFLREDDPDDDTRYKLSEVGIFTILKYHSSTESKIVNQDFQHYSIEEIEKYDHNYTAIILRIKIPITVDGHYSLQYFAVPLDNPSFLGLFNYYCDDCGRIYDSDDNLVHLNNVNFEYSNIMYFEDSLFFYNNLKSAYIQYVYGRLYSLKKNGLIRSSKPDCCGKADIEINENVIGSAIAAIRYLIEMCRFCEAQEIIEQLSQCNGIYNNSNCFDKYDCGCN